MGVDGLHLDWGTYRDLYSMFLMQSCVLLLGLNWPRFMYGDATSMVQHGFIPAGHRHRRPRASNSGSDETQTPKETEDNPTLRFSPRWSVCPIPTLLLVQLLTIPSGCIVSILRLHGLYAATISRDLTYDNALAVTWSTVEFNVGIMCACFPTLRPLVNIIWPKLINSTGRGTTASNPFPASSHSRAYYQRNDSTVELSRTAVATAGNADGNSSDRISFDTATKEPGIHVKQEWTVSEREDAESGTLGRAM